MLSTARNVNAETQLLSAPGHNLTGVGKQRSTNVELGVMVRRADWVGSSQAKTVGNMACHSRMIGVPVIQLRVNDFPNSEPSLERNVVRFATILV